MSQDTSWANRCHTESGLRFQIYQDECNEFILVLAKAYYESPIHKHIRHAVEVQKPCWTFKGCGRVTRFKISYHEDCCPSEPGEADCLLTEAQQCLKTLGINVEKA